MPPTIPAAPPREPAQTVAQEANPEKAMLQKLMQALGQHQEALPESVRELIAAQGRTEVQDHTKTLHRTVSAQATARRELQKLQQSRVTFLAAWSSYIADLTSLVTKQVEEQSKALAEMDEQETAWGGKLQEATATLAKLASGGVKLETKNAMEVEESEEAAAEMAEAKVDEAIATEQELQARRLLQQQSSLQLVGALKQAQAKADQDLANHSKKEEGRLAHHGEAGNQVEQSQVLRKFHPLQVRWRCSRCLVQRPLAQPEDRWLADQPLPWANCGPGLAPHRPGYDLSYCLAACYLCAPSSSPNTGPDHAV